MKIQSTSDLQMLRAKNRMKNTNYSRKETIRILKTGNRARPIAIAYTWEKVCQASFYHLKNINKIRRYLGQDATEILIHAYITSKLENCNSLLYRLPTY